MSSNVRVERSVADILSSVFPGLVRQPAVRHCNRPFASGIILLACLAALLFSVLSPESASAQTVPAVVVSSTTTVNTSGIYQPGKVVFDTCGNLYEAEVWGGLFEIPVGGGPATELYGGSNYNATGLTIDSNNNLYVDDLYGSSIYEIPSTNCVPQPSQMITIANNFGSLPSPIYYYSPSDLAIDTAGNLFISTGGQCCSNEILEETAEGKPAVVLSSFSTSETGLGVDLNDNVFFTDGTSLWEVAYTSGAYSATPVTVGTGFNQPVGVSFDNQGNLYVADIGNAAIYEIPYESGALNFSDQFQVAANVDADHDAGVDASGNLYYTQWFYSSSSIFEVAIGKALFGSEPIAQTAAATLNFLFNAATTPAQIAFLGGAGPGGAFSNAGGGSCAGGTAYTPGQVCTVNVTYKASALGVQTGAVALTDANGNAISTGYLSGVGQGAGMTLDPGTTAALGSGLKKPAGIAIDATGNVYIADATSNAVIEFPAGGGASVSLGTSLSGPTGVAVDGGGNVFIADTGNNQVVEVPVVNGALSNAAQVVVQSGLTAPAGLAVDGVGNLYIANTGGNQITLLPNHGGAPASLIPLGSGLSAPLAVAVDSLGGIYIADSGNGRIVKIAPGVSSLEEVAVGLSNPSALALDASGSLIVVDQGYMRVLRIPSEDGELKQNDEVEVDFGIADPYGATLDAIGNLYVTDSTNAAAYTITRTQGALAFGDWAQGATSGAISGTLESSGNQALTLSSPFYVATGNTGDFAQQSPNNACANSATIAVGTDCVIAAKFTPTALGARSETLTLASNAANATNLSVVLAGNGTNGSATTTTLALTSPAGGSPFYGEAVTITATVASTGGGGTPTGSVTFLVDGAQQPADALSGGVATLNLPDGLAGGSHSISADYDGSSTFSGSVATPLLVTVTQAPTTAAVAIAPPFINPLSALINTPVIVAGTIASTGEGIPTGTLTFMNGATVLATQPVQPQAGGTFGASFTFSSPSAGTYNITAVYSGDSNYLASTSPASPTLTIVAVPVSTVVPAGSTVTASGSAPGSVGVTISSYGGWYGVVVFQCAGLPIYATCTAVPGYALVYPGTKANQIQPTQAQIVFNVNVPPNGSTASLFLTTGTAAFGIFLIVFRRRKGAHSQFLLRAGMLLLLIGVIQGIPACSSSGSPYMTPAGTSMVTVTATPAQIVPGNTQSPPLTEPPDPVQIFPVTLTVK